MQLLSQKLLFNAQKNAAEIIPPYYVICSAAQLYEKRELLFENLHNFNK